jgi:uncharacterized protein (DUF2141 family)
MNTVLNFYLILVLALLNINNSYLSSNAIAEYQNKNGIELIISNIQNKEGFIRIGLFNSETGYPDKPTISYSLSKDTISGGKMVLFIPLSRPGRYGVSILDDENGNGKMDYFLKLIPKEGFGFSNNPKIISRKAPPFSDTLFRYSSGRTTVNVKMVYL